MVSTDKSSSRPSSSDSAFEAGQSALTNADWRRACDLFREATRKDPTSAEAWAGLAAAAYWLPDEEAIFEARERAYHLFREHGDIPNAARMAAWLAVDWIEMRGQEGLANGWMQRARRHIQKHPETPPSAWVSILNTRFLMLTGAEAGAVRRMAARSAARARRFGLSDIEALSLTAEGHARLSAGDVERAMRCLDEAAAVILGREVRDLTAAALTLCSLMGACERTRDFDRARQWCVAARQFSEDQGFPIVLSICRPHYGAVLMWRGHWPEAEEHLQIGSRELWEFMPPFAVGALALLGALRWRQGRWDEAEEILQQVRHEAPAQVPLAELLAAKGDTQEAVELLERHLRGVPPEDKLERSPVLELLVRCLVSVGGHERAAGHLPELHAIAGSVRTPAQRAAAAFAGGVVAGGTARWADAQELLGDAVELYERAGAPFESARARIALAETLCARHQLDAAVREAHIAHETLRRIGAAKEAERAAAVLATLNARRKLAAGKSPDGLTAREAEILALVAEGRSNQEIAADLVLSVRTVERHISNIYQKLGLDGRTARAAAAVYAHRAR
jgi:LuxR family transcriptional regulator, maltose regulon positive regulatory protein